MGHISLVWEDGCNPFAARFDSEVSLYTRVSRPSPKGDQGNWMMGVRVASRVRCSRCGTLPHMTEDRAVEAIRLREQRRRLQNEYRRLEQVKIPRDAAERLHTRERQLQGMKAEMQRIDERLAQLAREETS